jgi:hypothetical protein
METWGRERAHTKRNWKDDVDKTGIQKTARGEFEL